MLSVRGRREQRGRPRKAAQFLTLPVLVLACANPPAPAPQDEIATALAAGRHALQAGHFEQARAALAPALEGAHDRGPQ